MPNTKIYNINKLFASLEFFDEIKSLAKNFIIFCDENVLKIYEGFFLEAFNKAKLNLSIVSFKAGEENKTRATKEYLENELLKCRVNRDTLLIALGGGVTTDLIGFLAATYLRGVKVVFIPTTLLAMVDASIGGKVGVNTSFGKNLIGAFYHPAKVFIDQCFLNTLPTDELINGYVEMLKHGLINSYEHFQLVNLSFKQKKIPSVELVLASIQIKQKIVALDYLDQNIRKSLNFGHTFGHAIEILSNFQVPHGRAVAIGILMESYLSMKLQFLSKEDFYIIKETFQALTIKEKYTLAAWKNALSYDKKNNANSIEYITLKKIGEIKRHTHNVTHPLSDRYLSDVIDWIQQANYSKCTL